MARVAAGGAVLALAGAAAALAGTPARSPGAALQEAARPLAPQASEAIAAVVGEEMARLGIPGLSAALGDAGELRFAAGWGLADVENDVPSGADTVYRLASISKSITAVAALRLAEAGRLDLDAAAATRCSAYPAKPWPLSARQLLSHQGGVRHYRPGEQPPLRHHSTLAEALALFKDDPLVFEPGTSVLYSTYGYAVLGCVIEGAAGRSFGDVVRDEVFTPAGMRNTGLDDLRGLVPHRASGYVRAESGELLNSAFSDVSFKVPGGGLAGTAPDVARFGLALLSGRLLGHRALHEMLTPQRTRSGRVTGFGLGVTLTAHGGRREAWHTGGQEQVSGVIYMRPEAGLVVALLANLEGVATPLLHLSRRIADLATAESAAR